MTRAAELVPAWAPALLVSLSLRIPLAFLAGPGRDEAAYYYWAQNMDTGYASLMLAFVRVLEAVGIPALGAIRIPGLLGGVASLVLFDKFLSAARVERRARVLALLVLAVTPWHVLVGSVLHPDTGFLCALLALAMSLRAKKPMWVAACGGAAILAKPTGIVLLPMLTAWLWRHANPSRRVHAFALLALMAAPAVTWLSPSSLREIFDFGRLDGSLPIGTRSAIALAGVAVQGGLLLPLAALQGAAESVGGARQRRERSVFMVAASLILFFLLAAVLNDQFKGNWILPALVLLWPERPLRIPRVATGVLLFLSLAASVSMVMAMRRPDLAERAEARLALCEWYPRSAGVREQRASATRTFAGRFREFNDMAPTADETLQLWGRATGLAEAPRWIVSDDYGLAAQLAYQWRSTGPGVLIPADGLFNRRVADVSRSDPRDVLVMAVRTRPEQVWRQWGPVREIGAVRHPVTGDWIALGVSSAVDNISRED